MKIYSFPPIVNSESKIIILGTIPGNLSLIKNEYYANPQNQFWKILTSITNKQFNATYDEKIKLLLKSKIALWDVLKHCERGGSLDSNISEEFPNDLKTFFNNYPNIIAVLFNGAKAEKLFNKYSQIYNINKDTLPSTSSANTSMNLNNKTAVWRSSIGKYL